MSEEKNRIDKYTAVALVVCLIIYPLLYSFDFFSRIVFPLLSDESIAVYFDQSNRVRWWVFYISNTLYHWIPFFFIWFALYKNKEKWTSIGLNIQWFSQYKYYFIVLLAALIVAAFVMPSVHYGDQLPQNSSVGFFGPVSTVERLVVIFMSFTAAFTEEVMFRGFAFNRLNRWIPNPWFILPITLVSFLLIHGEPDDMTRNLSYLIGGCAFGIPFVLMGLKRLELLIVIHFFIDAAMVLAP